MQKRHLIIGLSILVVIVSLAVACAPKAANPPASTAGQASKVTASAQDAAWADTVAAAKKEGKLTLYTWGMAGQPGVKVQKAFKDAYGIEIETVAGVVPTLIERMKTEAASGKNMADTFDASTSSVQIVKTAGLLQPIGDLPALRKQSDFRSNPVVDDGYMMTVGVNYRATLINTSVVKAADEPKSYKALLDPKWKGKIVIPSPVTAVGINQLYSQKERLGLDDDYFRQLSKNGIIVVATDKDAADMVARGDAGILPSSSLLQSAPDAVKGAPVKAIFPTEGTLGGFGNTWSLLKNPAHPNAAKVFLNWLQSPEGQKVYGEASAWTPIRNDVPDYIPASLAVPSGIKAAFSDLANEGRIADLRTQRTVAKLMGIEK